MAVVKKKIICYRMDVSSVVRNTMFNSVYML